MQHPMLILAQSAAQVAAPLSFYGALLGFGLSGLLALVVSGVKLFVQRPAAWCRWLAGLGAGVGLASGLWAWMAPHEALAAPLEGVPKMLWMLRAHLIPFLPAALNAGLWWSLRR